MRIMLAPLAVLAAAAAPAAIAAPAPSGWDGRYVYEEYAGRTAGGSPIMVTWTLTIRPGHCSIHAEGYQTFEDLRCGTTAKGNTLAVRWISYADGSLQNQYGVRIYKPQQHLFTLTRAGKGLTTTWGGLQTNKEGKRPGRYFKKA